MPTSEFHVPKGTRLEVVYSIKRTTSFTVSFLPDNGGSEQVLVSEVSEGESGDFIPFILLTSSGKVKIVAVGTSINGVPPDARVLLCASPFFMSKIVLSAGGTQESETRIVVNGEGP